VQPDENDHLATQTHVEVPSEAPEYTANAHAIGTLRLLEAIRILKLQDEERVDRESDRGIRRAQPFVAAADLAHCVAARVR
jgi:dTDP-D-glucose 4,6-dehydratase